MSEFAIWRRLDTPGHDAAFLAAGGEGWSLRGMAVFRHAEGPACVSYAVDLDRSWRTVRGRVQGFLAGRTLDHAIERTTDGWTLDGARIDGLAHLVDLDYGFTPATNLQQLRRAAPAVGAAVDLPAAWFDLDRATLTELPQRYERRSADTYWYTAPTAAYEGLLELSASGFVRHYPGLWTMES